MLRNPTWKLTFFLFVFSEKQEATCKMKPRGYIKLNSTRMMEEFPVSSCERRQRRRSNIEERKKQVKELPRKREKKLRKTISTWSSKQTSKCFSNPWVCYSPIRCNANVNWGEKQTSLWRMKGKTIIDFSLHFSTLLLTLLHCFARPHKRP